ncbi:FadR family transcriptional regulator [Microbacterium protaetiae]|uniref:FadR family transcriptional regulator n=1 Tax=Microbacterium protaetiae TaxID=2509458 RepID=A0A4P6EAN4_9MICO|nr:FCD domain-containing protein [Microbacterium protaetiae]QAY58546.1 FadR family transcriptional regulator [Microbacterium protaetiae]
MPQLARPAPLAEQAADALRARIAEGEWPLGGRLPGETTLATELGVGRSTVREALRQLAGRGIVESRQGAGVFVRALSAPDDWDQVLRRADIISVLEARVAIEAEAATLAAARRTPIELRAMRRLLEARDGLAGTDIAAYVEADALFHRAIVAAAHNEVLLQLFDGFVPRMRRAMVDMLGLKRTHADAASDREVHAGIIEAIAARDAAAAASRTRAHLAHLAEALA